MQPNLGGLPGGQANALLLQQMLAGQGGMNSLSAQHLLSNQQAPGMNQLRGPAPGQQASAQAQLLNNLILQHQLQGLAQQQAQQAQGGGMRQAGGAGLNGANPAGINPALAAAILSGQLGPGSAAGMQQLLAQQAQQAAAQQQAVAQQQAQQQLLIQQALRQANGLQTIGLGQRQPAQLQSEALIAMQRQQLQAQQGEWRRLGVRGGGIFFSWGG